MYRDRLWQGADLAGLGVASFGHVNGVHLQNLDTWETYGAAIERGELPLGRAYRPTDDERMIREFVLQMKRGSVRPAYFAEKYGVDVLDRFRRRLPRSRPLDTWRRGTPTASRSLGKDCSAWTSCCTGFSCPSTPGFAIPRQSGSRVEPRTLSPEP